MESLSSGQVVLATFPFSDLTSKKRRPCLILGIAEFGDIVLCQITSRRYHSKQAVSLTRRDFSQGSIVVDSFIRPDKIATLDATMIESVLGTLTDEKHIEVKAVLQELLEIN